MTVLLAGPEGENGDTWEKLTKDARNLAIFLAIGHSSQSKEALVDFSEEDEGGFDLDKGLTELSSHGLLEVVTNLEEAQEELARRVTTARPLALMRDEEVPIELLKDFLHLVRDENERKCLELGDQIESWQDPDKFPRQNESRYRLRADFRDFILENNFDIE